MYSTCSLNPIENEAVVASAMAQLGVDKYRVVPPPTILGSDREDAKSSAESSAVSSAAEVAAEAAGTAGAAVDHMKSETKTCDGGGDGGGDASGGVAGAGGGVAAWRHCPGVVDWNVPDVKFSAEDPRMYETPVRSRGS